jgi:hypothetical protein
MRSDSEHQILKSVFSAQDQAYDTHSVIGGGGALTITTSLATAKPDLSPVYG